MMTVQIISRDLTRSCDKISENGHYASYAHFFHCSPAFLLPHGCQLLVHRPNVSVAL